MNRAPILLTTLGFILWSAAFLALYGLQATGCRLGWQDMPLAGTSLLRVALIALLALSVAATLLLRRGSPASAAGPHGSDTRSVGLSPITLVRLMLVAVVIFNFHGIFWLTLC